MKRINIYITEDTDQDIDNLSELLQVNRSEIMRKAITEFSDKHASELDSFIEGLEDLSIELPENNNRGHFLVECENNPEFFIENCLKINTIDEGISPFTLYKHQKHLLFKLDNYEKIVMNTSRQLGLSTLMTGYMLHYMIFNQHKNVVVVSPKQSQASEYVTQMRDMIERLPDFMKANLLSSVTKTRISFKNGSTFIASSASVGGCRGMSINYLFVDNFAHIPRSQADEFIASIFPVITSNINSKIVVASTPDKPNHFYKMWTDAISNYNSFQAIKLPWYLMETRDDEWEINQKISLGEKTFGREFNCEFNYEMKGDLYAV
jgi:hypothetical protein